MKNIRLFYTGIRYIILFLIALPGLSLFYLILTPLTIYPSSFIINLFYNSEVLGNNILVGNIIIEIIPACIAGAAFYLLLILNLSTPMKAKIRFYSIIFSFLLFLAVNIARISVFSILIAEKFQYFSFTHLFFWYFLSSILVILVWILTIRTFKIDRIPFYTDLNLIYKLIKK